MKPTNTKDQLLVAALMAQAKADPYPKIDLDDTVYLPEIRPTSYALNPALLCCALFGIDKGKLKTGEDGKQHFAEEHIKQTFTTTNGAIIEYSGDKLGQHDLTVLLGLLQKHSGMATSCEIEFFPTSFCSKIGWSDSDHNIKRLKSCLLRLRKALLVIKTAKPQKDVPETQRSKLAKAIGSGWTLGFVADFRWDGVERWSVQIDRRIGQIFNTAPTYLIAAKRKALTEGLQTWLYGYIEANSCEYAVRLEIIHRASGSKAKLSQFARQVRNAIPKLVNVGTLRDHSTVKNGKVALFKVPSSRPKKRPERPGGT